MACFFSEFFGILFFFFERARKKLQKQKKIVTGKRTKFYGSPVSNEIDGFVILTLFGKYNAMLYHTLLYVFVVHGELTFVRIEIIFRLLRRLLFFSFSHTLVTTANVRFWTLQKSLWSFSIPVNNNMRIIVVRIRIAISLILQTID